MSPDLQQSPPQYIPPTRRTGISWKVILAVSLSAIALVAIGILGPTLSPPARGTVRENPRDGQRYVWIPAGEYLAGCSTYDPDCGPDEKPSHNVTLSKGFWMGQTEVTVEAYRKFATATQHNMPPESTFGNRSLNPAWKDVRMPIVNVDWHDSQAFCKWAGGSLPTEAQWEYAARSDNASVRYGELSQIAWIGDNAGKQHLDTAALLSRDEGGFLSHLSDNQNSFHAVGLLAPNQFGLYDMLGNVWEWTADWYGESYYQESNRFDPTGRQLGDAKVLRGGSWTNAPSAVRVSVRGRRTPVTRSVDAGFRCVW